MCTTSKHAGGIPPIAVLSIALAIISCSPCCGSPPEQSVTLVQGVGGYSGCSDTWLYEYTETNYGDDDSIYVHYNADGDFDRATLIRFDLAGKLPSGACIKSATLRLYQVLGLQHELLGLAHGRRVSPDERLDRGNRRPYGRELVVSARQ